LTQAALPHLLKSGGSVLYVASITGVEATPAPLPYSAAKAALMNYAKNLARQLGPQKVRVNTIAPGNILFRGGNWEKRIESNREAVETMLKNEVPAQRFGTPEEIASLAVWLCSEQAGFATGGCFVVDGGQTRSV
jgi:3-oxoacyl-[acyl-carrier protein] reductase